jgi:hypothetical protein
VAAEIARQAEAERAAAEAADRKRAEDEKQAAEAKAKDPTDATDATDADAPGVTGEPPAGSGEGSDGQAIPGTPATGNPQLDRAGAIDLQSIRTERAPLMGSGTGAAGGAGAMAGQGDPAQRTSSSSATPLYKKWWFWAIVGVGGVIIIANLADSSDDEGDFRTQGRAPDRAGDSFLLGPQLGAPGSGATLLRW